MNSVVITGRLTAAPELRRTADGKALSKFTVAVKRPGAKDTVDFFSCVAWDKKAEFLDQFFKKGQRIEVSGFLYSNEWVDKNGLKRKDYIINSERVDFGASRNEEQSSTADGENEDNYGTEYAYDDLPF